MSRGRTRSGSLPPKSTGGKKQQQLLASNDDNRNRSSAAKPFVTLQKSIASGRKRSASPNAKQASTVDQQQLPPNTSNKKQKTASLQIIASASDLIGLRPPKCFAEGINLAKMVLKSQTYRTTFAELVPDVNWKAFDKWLDKTYCVKLSLTKESVTAFCCVYREDHPTTVFMNPHLILNMLDREDNDDEHAAQQASIFICVKLVHEISHLLHYYASPALRTSATKVTPTKVMKDTFKKRTVNSKAITECNTRVEYKDFGELVEKKIFGGLVEARSSIAGSFMDIEMVVIYPSRMTLFGNFIDYEQSKAGIEQGRFQLVKGAEYEAISAPAFTRVALNVSSMRASAPESDVIRSDSSDLAETEENEARGGFRT